MDFVAVVDQAIALLRQRGRVAYRTLKRQFQLDDEALEDLKIGLIDSQRLATDEQGTVLVWTGAAAAPPVVSADSLGTAGGQPPLAYTPPYLVEKILTSRTALEGERRQVTVLFADLKDSTELIRGLDPEAAQQLLDPAIHLMMDAVHRVEGTVNQVLGDGIMTLFGAPIAHKDHALRACHAALTMQTALHRYAELVELGAFAEGRVLGEEAIQMPETADHPFSRVEAYSSIGRLSLRQGDSPTAIAMLERSLGICQVANIQLLTPFVASELGAAYILAERISDALPLLEQAVAQGTATGRVSHLSLWTV